MQLSRPVRSERTYELTQGVLVDAHVCRRQAHGTQDRRRACEGHDDRSTGAVYREFVPLKTFETDFAGLPITNEWRLFYWRTTLLAKGYYWSSASDEAKTKASIDADGLRIAKIAARVAAEHATFFVIDVAETVLKGWTVIEVNSGEQAGLSEIDPETFYAALREAVERERILDICDACGVPEGEDHWFRAGGDVICDVCDKAYSRHPMDERHIGYGGLPMFHLICNGSLVKT